jgi:eukaryotic-like serine/threonine-protein kinase
MNNAAANHPGDESLLALSLGQLAEADLVAVSTHLGDCPECCLRIDELATDDSLLLRLKQKENGLVSPALRRQAVRAFRRSASTPSSANVFLPIPARIGDYDILGEVGRGGMGVVYQAFHRGLNRQAAVKMVLAGEFASPAQEWRFRLEAELAARVRHANFVQVYEVGRQEGRPFLALEWIDGGSLANRLNGEPWPARDAADLIETLARAMSVAHGEGVIHRDLKPSNIPMTTDGVPKIADFGLAQTVESNQTMTLSGLLVGTPGYMAPEQATGNRALVGPASDIHALGVIFYQLLTGRLPFAGNSTLELLRAVVSEEPPRPRRLLPRLPRDLEAIVLHCLEKEPARRYATAQDLADDLARFRSGVQVAARPIGAISRLGRTARRYPVMTLLLGLLAVSLLAGIGGVTWKWLDADEQRDRANANSRKADDEKNSAMYQTYRACLAAASASLENHDVADAARHLEAAPEALRGWEWRHLQSRLDDSSETIPLPRGNSLLVNSADRIRIGIWTDAGLRLTNLDGTDAVTVPVPLDRRGAFHIANTARGLRVATWAGDAFEILDETGQILCRAVAPKDAKPTVSALSRDGERLACTWANKLNDITIYDATSGRQLATCKGSSDTVWSLSFSPDGSTLASGGEDRIVRFWNPETGELKRTCRGHTSKIVHSVFSPDGTRLLTASSDGSVRQWHTHTGLDAEAPYDRHSSEVFSAVYSPDGTSIASTGADRTIRIWSATGRQDWAVLHGHRGRIADVAFTPDGRRLVSLSCRSLWVSSSDDTARIWDVDSKATLPVLRGHAKGLQPLAYSSDGRWLATGSRDGTARLWDAATGEHCATVRHPSQVYDLAFSPDGTWLVTTNTTDSRLQIWDTATAALRKEIRSPIESLKTLAVHPKGTHIASTGVDESVKRKHLTVFDIATGQSVFTTEGSVLAYSPDGRWLATLATDDTTVLLRDATTYETVTRFAGHDRDVYKGVFSANSKTFATCSHDKTVRVWHLANGECQVLRGHTDEVYAIAYHPDGTRLATGCQDGSVWVWDATLGESLVRLPGHKSFVWSLVFSPDGTTLASGSGDTTVRFWDTAPLKARYRARHEANAFRDEAHSWLEKHWRGNNGMEETLQALRSDQTVSEAMRREVLRTILRRLQPNP